MSRRRRAEDSSLELLLDTITNTFGGILFLAILVSLLLRTSSPTQGRQSAPSGQAMSAAEQAAYEVKLEDLQDRLTRLQKKRAATPVRRPAASPEAERESAVLAAALAEALEERARAGLETAAHQRAHADAMHAIAHLEERRSAAEERYASEERAREKAAAEAQELAQWRLGLDSSAQPSTIEQTAGMATLHDTDKRQVGIYLRFGKLYMMHLWRNGIRMGPNPSQFVVTPGDPPTARPKPGAGTVVEVSTCDAEVRRLLADFPPTGWVVAVVVFGDSFNEFQLVKRSIVEAGYEYNPFPVNPGGSVMDSGGDSRAQ